MAKRVLTRAEWNELIQEVNDVITDPPEGCDALDPIEEVDPKHRWKKSDIREIQEALSETCPEIEWEEIPDKWSESILDEIREKFAEAWCECEEECWFGVFEDDAGQWDNFGSPVEIPITPTTLYTDEETGITYWDWIEDWPCIDFEDGDGRRVGSYPLQALLGPEGVIHEETYRGSDYETWEYNDLFCQRGWDSSETRGIIVSSEPEEPVETDFTIRLTWAPYLQWSGPPTGGSPGSSSWYYC